MATDVRADDRRPVRRVPVRPRRRALPRGRSRPRRGRGARAPAVARQGLAFVTNNSGAHAPARSPSGCGGGGRRRRRRGRDLGARDGRAPRRRGVRSAVRGGGGGRPSPRCRRPGSRWPSGEPDAVDAVVVGWDRGADYDEAAYGGRPGRSAAPRWSRRTPTPPSRRPTVRRGRVPAPCSPRSRPPPACEAEVVGKPNPPICSTAARRAPAADAAGGRRPPRHRHRRGGRPGLGLAPRAHRHQRRARTSRRSQVAPDVRRRRPPGPVRRPVSSPWSWHDRRVAGPRVCWRAPTTTAKGPSR